MLNKHICIVGASGFSRFKMPIGRRGFAHESRMLEFEGDIERVIDVENKGNRSKSIDTFALQIILYIDISYF